MLVYLKALDNLHGDHPSLHRLLHAVGRVVLFKIILGLDAIFDSEDPQTWPTIGRIQKEMEAFGLTSPRSVDEVLGVMRHLGLVHIVAAPRDRRTRLVRPSEKMLREERYWLAAHYSPHAFLFPECNDYKLAVGHDRDFQDAQRRASAVSHQVAADVLDGNEPIIYFFRREMGAKVLYQYLMAGGLTPGERVGIAHEEVARRAGISRTHVRNILRDAAELGYLEIHGEGGQVSVRPVLMESIHRYMAKSWAALDHACCLAVELMRQDEIAATRYPVPQGGWEGVFA